MDCLHYVWVPRAPLLGRRLVHEFVNLTKPLFRLVLEPILSYQKSGFSGAELGCYRGPFCLIFMVATVISRV